MNFQAPKLCFQDGDAARLTSMDFEVSLPALSLAARSGRKEILELLLQRLRLHRDAERCSIHSHRSSSQWACPHTFASVERGYHQFLAYGLWPNYDFACSCLLFATLLKQQRDLLGIQPNCSKYVSGFTFFFLEVPEP